MNTTRITLIEQLHSGGNESWSELNAIYRPMISNWLRRYQLNVEDVEDITQEVMTVVANNIQNFVHNGRTGAFRNWLKTTTVNLTRTYLRKKNTHGAGAGTDALQSMLNELEDPHSQLSEKFNHEHDEYVVKRVLERIQNLFHDSTLEAFKMHVIDGVSSKETAEKLGISVTAVHIAKSRILRKLREQAEGWIDEIYFS